MMPFNDSPKWIFWKYLIHICLGLVLVYAAYSVKKKANNTPSINARSIQYLPDTLIEKDTLTAPDIFIDSTGSKPNADTSKSLSQEVFNTYETYPEFPGGNDKIAVFIKKNMRYPKEAIKNNIEGRVTISFKVQVNGKVTNIQLRRGVGYGCDEEALRIVGLMPKWKPGTINNAAQEWHYNLPIMFNLKDAK